MAECRGHEARTRRRSLVYGAEHREKPVRHARTSSDEITWSCTSSFVRSENQYMNKILFLGYGIDQHVVEHLDLNGRRFWNLSVVLGYSANLRSAFCWQWFGVIVFEAMEYVSTCGTRWFWCSPIPNRSVHKALTSRVYFAQNLKVGDQHAQTTLNTCPNRCFPNIAKRNA